MLDVLTSNSKGCALKLELEWTLNKMAEGRDAGTTLSPQVKAFYVFNKTLGNKEGRVSFTTSFKCDSENYSRAMLSFRVPSSVNCGESMRF